MPRPRFAIGPDDWSDTLDWLEFQLRQPAWLANEEHPIHEVGPTPFTDRIRQFQYVDYPSHPDCEALQKLLTTVLTRSDWDRLRKTLSARRRRRRERHLHQGPVNLTLSVQAHHWLKQLTHAGRHSTISEALETHLPDLVANLEAQTQQRLHDSIQQALGTWSTAELLDSIERYLAQAKHERGLATACRIAYQWYRREPDPNKASLMRERFIEDLVWNESHLKRAAREFISQGE